VSVFPPLTPNWTVGVFPKLSPSISSVGGIEDVSGVTLVMLVTGGVFASGSTGSPYDHPAPAQHTARQTTNAKRDFIEVPPRRAQTESAQGNTRSEPGWDSYRTSPSARRRQRSFTRGGDATVQRPLRL
jgi:hypothetical protein